MLKNSGIEFFPPIDNFKEAYSTFCECGGMMLSLEDGRFLVDEPRKICKLYGIEPKDLHLYLKQTFLENGLIKEEVDKIIEEWLIAEKINDIKL